MNMQSPPAMLPTPDNFNKLMTTDCKSATRYEVILYCVLIYLAYFQNIQNFNIYKQ